MSGLYREHIWINCKPKSFTFNPESQTIFTYSKNSFMGNKCIWYNSCQFFKVNNFSDFQFAFLQTNPFLTWALLLKARFCSRGTKFFPFRQERSDTVASHASYLFSIMTWDRLYLTKQKRKVMWYKIPGIQYAFHTVANMIYMYF